MSGERGTQQTGSKTPTTTKRLFACGVGNFYNDLASTVVASFGLVYYMKVIELNSFQAGLVLVLGELSSFISNIIFGHLCDNVDVPGLSRRIGRRKAWHLIGTALVSVSFMLAFSRCLPCTNSSSSWVAFGYYAVMYSTASFGYGAVDLSHITTIPEVSQSDDETVLLNSIRTGFFYLGGICAYGVAWVILGQNSNGSLNPDNWKEFTLVSVVCTTAGLNSVSLVFGINTDEDQQRQRVQVANTRRKESSTIMALRKISAYIVPSDATLNRESDTARRFSAPVLSTERHASPADVLPGEEERTKTDYRKAKEFHQRKTATSVKPPGLLTISEDPSLRSKHETMERKQEVETADDIKLGKLSKIVSTCHVEIDKPEKSLEQWLKDPQLYKVTTLFVCASSPGGFACGYLALYLTDHLQYNKEATAYFSLVFLVSGLVGTATTKKLDEKIGRTKTNCLASSLAVLAAVWFYFVPKSTKQLVYAPIALIGCSVSGMLVMALSHVADVISDEKESSRFVCSFVSASQKLTTGLFLMVIQNFYPLASSPDRGPYIRWVFPVVLGVFGLLPLIGMVVMLISERCEAITCFETPLPDQVAKTTVTNPSEEPGDSVTNTGDGQEGAEWHASLYGSIH